jgi:hypothetical protein
MAGLDSLEVLFTQLNISGNDAASLTSVLQGIVQNMVIAATILPVTTASPVITPHTIPFVTQLHQQILQSIPPHCWLPHPQLLLLPLTHRLIAG